MTTGRVKPSRAAIAAATVLALACAAPRGTVRADEGPFAARLFGRDTSDGWPVLLTRGSNDAEVDDESGEDVGAVAEGIEEATGAAHVTVGYDAGLVDAPSPAPSALGPDSAPWDELADLRQRLAGLESRLGQRDAADRKAAGAARRRFAMRPFGRLHLDAVFFDQDAANKAVVGDAPNGVDIRRARLGVEGEGLDVLFYRFDVDFVSIDASTRERPAIFDAYLEVREVPVVGNVRIGHFREPIGLDRLDSSHDFPFMERAAVTNALVPFRNLGLMAFDWNEAETWTWAYGVFTENSNEFGESAADSPGVSGTGRVTWLPYFAECDGGPHLLHLGSALSLRHVGENALRRFGSPPELLVREGDTLRTPNFVDTGLLPVADYLVWGTEIAYDRGPWYVQAESVLAGGELTNGTSFGFVGGYVETGVFLTGETRVYDRRAGIHRSIVPHDPVFGGRDGSGPRWGRGAWETAVRLSYVDLDDGTIAGGRMTDFTFGLNWYLMSRSRVMFDYVRSHIDRSGTDSEANVFGARFQYAF